jgi:periplasmic protein TonB
MPAAKPSRPSHAKPAPRSDAKPVEARAAAPRKEGSRIAREMAGRQSAPRQRFRHWVIVHSLGVSVGLSIWLHGMLPVLIGFKPPDPTVKKAHDEALAVVLVNAKHAAPPKVAQALAQTNLEGGGDQEKRQVMPSSPLPPKDSRRDGEALIEMQQKVQRLESLQKELLRKAQGAGLAVPQPTDAHTGEQPVEPEPAAKGLDLSNASAIARQEAVVKKSLNDYASRPRKGIISPSTREYRLAQYGEDWRIKVERVGELNFPRGAQGSLYGSVQVSVEIAPDGSIISAEITRPDLRTPKINEAALRIIRQAAPFAPIPPQIRQQYDVLVLIRTLNFTRDDINVVN